MTTPLHPERSEAHEAQLDAVLPYQAPLLPLLHRTTDPRRVIVTIPAPERHRLYVNRLVVVDGPGDQERKACIEELGAEQAVVRYID